MLLRLLTAPALSSREAYPLVLTSLKVYALLLVSLKVYALVLRGLNVLPVEMRLGDVAGTEVSNICVVEVGRGCRHGREEVWSWVWVVAAIVEAHHLVVVHIVHVLEIFLIVIVPGAAVMAVMVLSLSGALSALLPHFVLSPMLVPPECGFSFLFSPLLRILSLGGMLNFLIG